ncbi:MAG TPA: STAS domain-containing protein [Gemmatimonadales bacterium]|nr:STAS domain-containing protein [Gemmatimonadales bacterium]
MTHTTNPVAVGPRPPRRPTLLRLRGPVDPGAVDDLRRQLAGHPEAGRDLLVRCAGVTAVDPVGAARLWLWCREVTASGRHRVRLVDLPERFVRRLRRHPLAGFLGSEDEVFTDPFRDPGMASPR